MANFSRNEIEEAKKRVREMQMRANSFIGAENSEKNHNFENQQAQNKSAHNEHSNINDKDNNTNENKSIFDFLGNDKGQPSDSSFIILMLLLILSHEGADSKLLLALLYLLL